MKQQPIIRSMLDTDWYKLTMRKVIAKHYPNAIAKFDFINRGKHKFPTGFHTALWEQIEAMSDLRVTDAEKAWAIDHDVLHIVDPRIRLKKEHVVVAQDGDDLEVLVMGPWHEATLWEVPLMATIAELYYKMTEQTVSPGFIERMDHKAVRWIDEKCHWSDFGTRRRFSYSVQDEVNRIYRHYQPFFLGTSNPHFAMKYNIPVLGTYAHEGPMAMQVLERDNEFLFHEDVWIDHMVEEFGKENVMVLGDTLGLDTTLKYSDDLEHLAGFRIDSGDPLIAAGKLIAFYKQKGVDTSTKTLLFSDGLDTESVIRINKAVQKYAPFKLKYGIGTHLTNDVGLKPMNMVIKLTAIAVDDKSPFQHVVKLSDSPGKESGPSEEIARLKKKFEIN